MCEGGTVIDFQSIRAYYHLLKTIFRPADLYVLEVDPEKVKGVPSIASNALPLPPKDETCHIITSFDVLKHLLQPARFVSEVSRVLRPDRVFVLAIAKLGDACSGIAFLFGYTPSNTIQARAKWVRSQGSRSRSKGTKARSRVGVESELLDSYGFKIVGSHDYYHAESFYQQHGLTQKERELGFGRPAESVGRGPATSLNEEMILFCKKRTKSTPDPAAATPLER